MNPDLSGESQLCYPIHYQDLVESWRSHVLLYKIDALYLPNLLDWAPAETPAKIAGLGTSRNILGKIAGLGTSRNTLGKIAGLGSSRNN